MAVNSFLRKPAMLTEIEHEKHHGMLLVSQNNL